MPVVELFEVTAMETDMSPSHSVGERLQSGFGGLKFGNREVDLQALTQRFSKTFLCIGPICLRSGVGFGAGIGCGAGIGRGAAVFKVQTSPAGGATGGFTLPYQVMNQIPGGYQMIGLLKAIMRKFPGSQTGVGCGVGVGYGVGIGFQYGSGGSFGGRGGFGTAGGRINGTTGSYEGASGNSGGGVGGTGSGGSYGTSGSGGSGTSSQPVDDKIRRLEKRVEDLEEKVGLQLRMKELEERISVIEKGKRRR